MAAKFVAASAAESGVQESVKFAFRMVEGSAKLGGAAGGSAVEMACGLPLLGLAMQGAAVAVSTYNLVLIKGVMNEVRDMRGELSNNLTQIKSCVEKWTGKMIAAAEKSKAAVEEGFRLQRERHDEENEIKWDQSFHEFVKQCIKCNKMFTECGMVNDKYSEKLRHDADAACRDIDFALRVLAKESDRGMKGLASKRRPLITRKAWVIYSCIAVLDMEGVGDKFAGCIRCHLVEDGQNVLKEEVKALLNEATATPFYIGCELRDSLEVYSVLYSTISGPMTSAEGEGAQQEGACWEDGLELLRFSLSSGAQSASSTRSKAQEVEGLERVCKALGIPSEKYRNVRGESALQELEKLLAPEGIERSEGLLNISLGRLGFEETYAWQDTRKGLLFRPKSFTEGVRVKQGPWKGGRCVKTIGRAEGEEGHHKQRIKALAYAPDRDSLYSGSLDNTIVEWQSGCYVRTLAGRDSGILALVAGKKGVLFSGHFDGSIACWGHNRFTGQTPGAHEGGVYALALLDDGSLVSGGADGTVKMWGVKGDSLELSKTLRKHSKAVTSLVVADDGSFYSASLDGSVRHWSEHGNELPVLECNGKVRAIALADDGTLSCGTVDGRVMQWRNGRPVGKEKKLHSREILALAVSEDGAVFSGSEDETFVLGERKIERHGRVDALLFVEKTGVLFSGKGHYIEEWHRDSS